MGQSLSICGVCGASYDEYCLTCYAQTNTCALCYTEFGPSELVMQCKECMYLGHAENMKTWIQRTDSCPMCRTQYSQDGFRVFTIDGKQVKDLVVERATKIQYHEKIFDQFGFRLPFYEFQSVVLNELLKEFETHDRFLLVSPPGSGKTILGLQISSEFKSNTLVLVPNLAVLGSWMDRIEMFFDEQQAITKASEVTGRDIGLLKPITILTYHQINYAHKHWKKVAKLKKQKKGQDGIPLFERFVRHRIGLVILDEAHRLTGIWGKNVLGLLEALESPKVLGLTATPPTSETQSFTDLFHSNVEEIPRPLLVREKVLAPYRDLVICTPSLGEMMDEQVTNYKQSEEKFTSEFSPIVWELRKKGYVEIRLVNSYLNGITDYEKPKHSIAWLNQNNSLKLAIAMQVIHKEFSWLKDKFRVILLLESENIPSHYDLQFRGMGGAIGVFEALVKDPVIDMLNPVLVTGNSLLVDDDFTEEFTKLGLEWALKRRLEISIGSRKARKKGYSIIKGSGHDWDTETFTRYVTHLFELGLTKCVIGTKFLLGEGWDCLSLNTVIDLTTTVAYTTVNQVKGRALRRDPDDLDKVSNLWEVINHPAINWLCADEYVHYSNRHENYFGINEKGRIRNKVQRIDPWFREFTRKISPVFREKEKVNDDYYQVLLLEKVKAMAPELKANLLNRSMFTKAKARHDAFDLWKVGQKLGDLYNVITVQLTFPVPFIVNYAPSVDWFFTSVGSTLAALIREAVVQFLSRISHTHNILIKDQIWLPDEQKYQFEVIFYFPKEMPIEVLQEFQNFLLQSETQTGLLFQFLNPLATPAIQEKWKQLQDWILKPAITIDGSVIIGLPFSVISTHEIQPIEDDNYEQLLVSTIHPQLKVYNYYQDEGNIIPKFNNERSIELSVLTQELEYMDKDQIELLPELQIDERKKTVFEKNNRLALEILLANVSFVVPRPVLVREGILAPYRDLILFTPYYRFTNDRVEQNFLYDEIFRLLERKGYNEVTLKDEIKRQSQRFNSTPYLLNKLNSIRLVMVANILLQEIRALGANLQALILLPKLEWDDLAFANRNQIPRTNNIQFKLFGNLVLQGVIPYLKPVMITRNHIWVHVFTASEIIEYIDSWINDRNLEIQTEFTTNTNSAEMGIHIQGADWDAVVRSHLIEELAKNEQFNCFIIPENIIAEGWFNTQVNTVIDLRDDQSLKYLETNFLKADFSNNDRSINIWKILNHPKTNQISKMQFSVLLASYSEYFGIDDQGRIRNKVERIDTALIEPENNHLADRLELSMMNRATNRQQTYELWKVGHKISGLYDVLKVNIQFMYHKKIITTDSFELSYIQQALTRVFSRMWKNVSVEPVEWNRTVHCYECELSLYFTPSESKEKIPIFSDFYERPKYEQGYEIEIISSANTLINRILKFLKLPIGSDKQKVFIPVPMQLKGEIDSEEVNLSDTPPGIKIKSLKREELTTIFPLTSIKYFNIRQEQEYLDIF